MEGWGSQARQDSWKRATIPGAGICKQAGKMLNVELRTNVSPHKPNCLSPIYQFVSFLLVCAAIATAIIHSPLVIFVGVPSRDAPVLLPPDSSLRSCTSKYLKILLTVLML